MRSDSAQAVLQGATSAILLLVAAGLLGALVFWIVARLLRRAVRRRTEEGALARVVLDQVRGPFRLLLPLVAVALALPGTEGRFPPAVGTALEGLLHAGLVGAVTWGVVALLGAGEEAIARRYDTEATDNLQARKILTQTRILRRVAAAVVVILGLGVVLLQYDPFWELGTGILASAGVVGIVFGIAAQQTLGNVIAGLQIAATQPIRVDDVVIVEGEFGWVEEITLTYVVVRVWDRRRIVLPITHFVTQPFQNWTRTSSDLIGSVFLNVDYTVPVEAVRERLEAVVAASETWDGDVCSLQVTDASERTVTLRAIASAESAMALWDLRCEIREELIRFLRENYPEALPAIRTRVQNGPEAGAAATDPASA
jgi:small-conductance mechanosensitive channel